MPDIPPKANRRWKNCFSPLLYRPNLVLNCAWADDNLDVTFREPFDLLAKTVAAEAQQQATGAACGGITENWLPGPDSNQRPSG